MTRPATTRELDQAPAGLRVRPYRAGDEAGIVALYNTVFRSDSPGFVRRSPRMWQWEYGDRQEGRFVIVGEDDRGRMVAHYGALPVRVHVRGRETLAAQGVDTLVHPDWRRGLRRSSAFLAIARAYFRTWGNAGTCHCTYGFPNRRVLRIGTARLGYAPLHVPLPTVFFNLFTGGRPASRRRLDVVEVRRFGADTDRLWRRCRHAYPFALVRDCRYLNWRYADIPVPYRRFELRDRGALRGIFVLREGWTGAPILAVADYFSDARDVEALETALHHAFDVARRRNQSRVELWLPEHTPLHAHARRLGLPDR